MKRLLSLLLVFGLVLSGCESSSKEPADVLITLEDNGFDLSKYDDVDNPYILIEDNEVRFTALLAKLNNEDEYTVLLISYYTDIDDYDSSDVVYNHDGDTKDSDEYVLKRYEKKIDELDITTDELKEAILYYYNK